MQNKGWRIVTLTVSSLTKWNHRIFFSQWFCIFYNWMMLAWNLTDKSKTLDASNLKIPIAACSRAGTNPPVDFFVQGRSVRTATTRVSDPLHVMMIVLVDMQEGPVYLYSSLLQGHLGCQGLIGWMDGNTCVLNKDNSAQHVLNYIWYKWQGNIYLSFNYTRKANYRFFDVKVHHIVNLFK